MDTRKMTLFATIAAIALLAVGIGYAYTAVTTNSGNNVATEYVVLTQSNSGEATGAYTFAATADAYKVEWDTEDGFSNNSGTAYGIIENSNPAATYTKYTLVGAADTTSIDGYTVKQLGKSFVLNASKIGDATATVAVTCTGFAYDANAALFVKVGDDIFKVSQENSAVVLKKKVSGAYTGDSTFTINFGENTSATLTVSVFYGYTGAFYVQHNVGTDPAGPTANPISSGQLVFTATPSA